MPKYYILKEKEVVPVASVLQWAEWFETSDNERLVARTLLPGDIRIQTDFIGIDYGNNDYIFETLVFGGVLDGVTKRYATYMEAEKGHERMVNKVSNVIKTL